MAREVNEEPLKTEAFIVKPSLFHASLEANVNLLQQMLKLWPAFPSIEIFAATRLESALLKQRFPSEFIDLRMPAEILDGRSSQYLKWVQTKKLEDQVMKLLVKAYFNIDK